ncbi:MAG: hypothetical protein COB35_03215 [Gammaproteobacteria bacterium]|nr:MAG: hypothetical protein COB35_03215 [Gammaproteobacteria bacterium]
MSWDELKKIQKKIEFINRHRNAVAHAGMFKNEPDAIKVYEASFDVINFLAPAVKESFKLPFTSKANKKIHKAIKLD